MQFTSAFVDIPLYVGVRSDRLSCMHTVLLISERCRRRRLPTTSVGARSIMPARPSMLDSATSALEQEVMRARSAASETRHGLTSALIRHLGSWQTRARKRAKLLLPVGVLIAAVARQSGTRSLRLPSSVSCLSLGDGGGAAPVPMITLQRSNAAVTSASVRDQRGDSGP